MFASGLPGSKKLKKAKFGHKLIQKGQIKTKFSVYKHFNWKQMVDVFSRHENVKEKHF